MMDVHQVWYSYCGTAPAPAELLSRWNLDPVLLITLAAFSIVGLLRLRASERGRKVRLVLLVLLLIALFVSPFCALSSALFSARVVHHVLLVIAVAPLIVATLAGDSARLPGSLPGLLAVWTGAQALIFWLWHSPPLYAWALSSDAAYWLMQLSILATATGFWVALRRGPAPTAVAALLATMVQMGLLGALITFVRFPLYAPHLATTQAWGLSPLEDQQLAGLIMWAPSAGLYLALALALLGRWLAREGRLSSAT